MEVKIFCVMTDSALHFVSMDKDEAQKFIDTHDEQYGAYHIEERFFTL